MNYYDIYEEMNKIDDDASLGQNSNKKTVNELFDKPAKRMLYVLATNDLVDSEKLTRAMIEIIERCNGRIVDRGSDRGHNTLIYTAKDKEHQKIKKEVNQIDTTEFVTDKSRYADGIDAVMDSISIVG